MTPYKEQIDAVQAAQKAGKGGIVMPTGAGKSITMALLIQAMQVKTLIVCPNLELKRQLSETLLSLFGTLTNITIENIDSPNLKSASTYDMLIIDECHRSASSTYQKLNKKQWANIYHRFFFTATFFRNRDDEQLLFEGICGKVIYELTYKKAVKQGLIVPIEAYYIELDKTEVSGYTWPQVYSELVVNNEARNQAIANCLINLSSAGLSTLCLVKEIKHGQRLADLTSTPFANGQDEESRPFIKEFSDGQLRALIGTTGVLGEGVDTKACEFVIIAGLGKAKSAFMQNVGRSVRKYPGKTTAKVILIRDTSHKFTLRHFNAQKKILLDEFGIKPIKLDIA